jgi:hypothetical protein
MSSSIARLRSRAAALPAVVLACALAACAAHEMPPPMPLPMPPQAPPPGTPTTQPGAVQPDVTLGFAPRWGSPGSAVQVTAPGLTPNATVEIGFALPGELPRPLGTYTTDAQGTLNASVRVPDWAQTGRVYSFFVGVPGQEPRLIRDGFHIASADGTVRLEGTLTDEGVECPAMRSADGRLYTLSGDVREFGRGHRVIVEGTLPDVSVCMQGTTVEVRSIRRADG